MKDCKRVECMGSNGCIDLCWKKEPKQEQGEPMAEDKVKQLVKQCTHRDVDGNWYVDGVQLVHATCFALDAIMCRNTTPQQRKPLTNEQIAQITVGFYGSAIHHDDYEFARAIEAAHGITFATDFKE